jgi:hypothetical protein
MDAVSDNRHVPLCIDLDGTLIATDTLWEGLVSVLISRPWLLFAVIFWAISGKAVLKREIAARYARKGDEWPYRAEVLERIKLARESGQPVWLVTGAAESTARTIADHLGLFDRVLHSTDTENLTSRRKRERLVSLCGDGGFDYAGNSRDDLAVFDAARRAIIVAPDRAASRWGNSNEAELLPLEKISPLAILKSIRVHQWLKNILIAVPLVLNHEFADFDLVLAAIAAFFSFSFLASAVYIVNDISDLANDRQHPRKRLRPLGEPVRCRFRWSASPPPRCCLPRSGLQAFCRHCSGPCWRCTPITTVYTFVLKRKLLVDVFTLAGLYTAADHCRCRRDRHRAVILAARLLDLLLSQPGAGQALCRAGRTCRQFRHPAQGPQLCRQRQGHDRSGRDRIGILRSHGSGALCRQQRGGVDVCPAWPCCGRCAR